MNILELCLSPNKGGLELYFADISNALTAYVNVVNVVTKDSSIHSLLDANHSILTLKKSFHYLPLTAAKKLARMIDENQIDVIHIHWNKDLTLAVLAKLFSKTNPKLVLMRHMQLPSKKDSVFHRFLYRNIDHIIAITKTMERDLRRFIPQEVQPNISVNYLGVEPIEQADKTLVAQRRLQYDPGNQYFLIALVGRISYKKGHEFLLDALKIAKAKGLPFKALIVGHPMDEDYLDSLKQQVHDEELEEYMVFTGFVDEPRQLMQACDVLILPTVEETFGLVLIEAMSVGVPVIGSNRGGVPEIIDDKVTGLLFESCDSQSLFEALHTLYANPEQAKQYAHAALDVVADKFDKEKHVQRLVKCLEEVVDG